VTGRKAATAAALGVAAVGLGAIAARRLVADRGAAPELAAFGNGMPYTRFGEGAKTLLWIPDPSHAGHAGPYLRFMGRVVRPLADAGYTVFLAGHKPHLQPGCTLADLGDDYAALITEEFDGRVDLVVGDSGGGMIAMTVAARHPDRFGHIATVAAGRALSEEVRVATVESARLLAAGYRTDAAEVLVTAMFPQVSIGWVRRLMAAVIGRVSFPATVDPGDVVAGAEAMSAFDGREFLPDIAVPVLLVGGDRDEDVSEEVYRETAALIPDCTLRIYEGKNHLGTIGDPRLARDILDFAARPVDAVAAA
jgi:pimeloyl-ACP methyl ester carboxylesterase